jgi:hypothetical protein
VATPLLSVSATGAPLFTVKFTVPDGVPVRPVGVTVAVKVTDEPEMLGLALEVTTVVVLALVVPTV